MSAPLIVSIPHRLGREEATRRLKAGLTRAASSIPVLKVDGHSLTQSISILEWLDETYPNPPLLPPAPLDRAYVRALALSIACDIHPLQNLRVLIPAAELFDSCCRFSIPLSGRV